MTYNDLSIVELHQLLVEKKVTPLDLTLEAIKLAKEDKTNGFETICENEAIEFASSLGEPETDNMLWGIPFVSKDNFSTKNILTTASSDILKDYIPVFDATTIKRLKERKCVLIGKTTLDELAMGGSGSTGHLGKTYNPYDPSKKYLVGGSSCGSASITAQGIVSFSLGSDTGDSVRKPASYAGLVGFKPSWGRISRFGLFPFAPSLDHVAYFTRSVKDAAIVLEALAGRDENDSTSSDKKVEEYYKNLNSDVKGKKVFVINQIIDSVKDPIILSNFNKALGVLKESGVEVEHLDFDLNLLQAIYPSYMIISCAEATSNNANLDGIKFGLRCGNEKTYQDVMINARTKGFGELIRRRFVIGSFSLYKDNQDELFLRAQKARHLIVDAFNQLFEKYDAFLAPCGGSVRIPFENETDRLSSEYLVAENHLAIGNFGGFPSISIPMGLDNNFPMDLNITTKPFSEQACLNIALAIESKLGLENLSVKKVNL